MRHEIAEGVVVSVERDLVILVVDGVRVNVSRDASKTPVLLACSYCGERSEAVTESYHFCNKTCLREFYRAKAGVPVNMSEVRAQQELNDQATRVAQELTKQRKIAAEIAAVAARNAAAKEQARMAALRTAAKEVVATWPPTPGWTGFATVDLPVTQDAPTATRIKSRFFVDTEETE